MGGVRERERGYSVYLYDESLGLFREFVQNSPLERGSWFLTPLQ